ncbi:MAG: hypothetical protein KAQ99_10205 [Candidatus Aureabacteria bacterium]|nr:hypothetical protein [Candidatus Auribacterota bacterium]
MNATKTATKTNLSGYELKIVKTLQDEEAVLLNRLNYARNRREVERLEVEAELKKVQAALDWFLGEEA